MKEQLIAFETAKLAKEKGFSFDTKRYINIGNISMIKTETKQPTQSLLQKWLREVHQLDVTTYSTASGYDYGICKAFHVSNISGGTEIDLPNKEDGYNLAGRWDTYEEALEVGLQEALKLI